MPSCGQTSGDKARHREHLRVQHPSLRPPRPSLFGARPLSLRRSNGCARPLPLLCRSMARCQRWGPGRKAIQVGATFDVVQALSTPAAMILSRRLPGRPAKFVSPHGIGVLRLFVRRCETQWAIIWIRRRARSVTACFVLTVIRYDVDGYLMPREHTPSCAPG